MYATQLGAQLAQGILVHLGVCEATVASKATAAYALGHKHVCRAEAGQLYDGVGQCHTAH